jgi:uncharacterized protein
LPCYTVEHMFNKETTMDLRTAPSQETIDQFVGVCHGDVASVRAMLEENPDLALTMASFGETPIEAAAQMANREIAEMLIAQGAPIDICTAASLGRIDLVEEMLDDDPSLKDAKGAHGIPLLYFPAVVGRVDIAALMIERGADINAGEGSVPPLTGAAMFGKADMARWLLAQGADPLIGDYEGKTALEVAEANGHEEVAAVLREAVN